MRTNKLLHLGLCLLFMYCFAGCRKNDAMDTEINPVATVLLANLKKPTLIVDDLTVNDEVGTHTSSDKVFVCKSANATKYHYKENCSPLKRCKHTIVKISKKEAENMGLGLCGFED